QVLQYDDVMNLQREVIYKQRKDILSKENLREDIMHMLSELVDDALAVHCPANLHPDEWELQPLLDSLHEIFLPEGMVRVEDLEGKEREEMQQVLVEAGTRAYEQKEQEFGEEAVRELERMILLRVVDSKWMEHLDAMDNLREGVGLRAYGQQDPLVEYKKEAYDMYQNMLGAIREEVIRMMFHLQLAPQQPIPTLEPVATVTDQEPHRPFQVIQGGQGTKPPKEGQGRQLGRNDPCWCGSGKKYKKCHGADQETQ
ncbi:MAG: preprotein translocase subunit SecA, partial [Sulfobacillus thermosulfidooxidans]